MSIVAECPHCETRFNLQPDLIGKSMRCPNPDCREVFTVQPIKPAGAKPAPKPPAPPRSAPGSYASGAVGDIVPVVEAEVVQPAPPPQPKPPRQPKPKPAPPPEPEVVEATVVAPPPVKEVAWSPDMDLPPGGNEERPDRGERGRGRGAVRAAAAEEEDEDALYIRRPKKKKNRAVLVLFGMGFLILAAITLGAAKLMKVTKGNEDQLAQEAKKQYDEGQYAAAAKSYEKLAADYPRSDDVAKYNFFAELAGVRATVHAVGNRDNPAAGLAKLKSFVGDHRNDPLAKPSSGYGGEIYATARKLSEDIEGFITERIAAFRSDRTKADELKRAEEMIGTGRELIAAAGPFRPEKEATPLESFAGALEKAKGEIDRERNRLAVIARVRQLTTTPTDEAIEEAKRDLAANGLSDDPEGREVVRTAEAGLLRGLQYERDPADPPAPPPHAASTILFVAPVGPTKPSAPGPGAEQPPTVFLAVARGVLSAIDEETGNQLWAVRVGADATDAPAVARLDVAGGATEVALVTSNVAGRPALAAYVLKTGTLLWYQPLEVADPKHPGAKLPAPAAGPAVVVGTRAYVPLRDPLGTVFEFDLARGTRTGRFSLGQPIGPGAVLRPGSGQLFVPAEARRVFVFDVDTRDDEGNRQPPRCTRVIPTGHSAGTLRAPPVVLGAAGEGPGNRWLLLSQADGSETMKLRAFPIPPSQPLPADAPPATDPIAPAAEVSVPGWAWFAPVADSERCAVVTDQGQFRLFGLNQPNNNDPAIFPIPTPPLPAPPEGKAVRGLVVPGEEGSYWVLANGGLQQFRLMLRPETGLLMAPVGFPTPLGEPTQPAQWNARRDTVCLVVRSVNSSGCRAVAVRVRDGEVRWQRQLGSVAASTPVVAGGSVFLAGEDGGVVSIPAAGTAIPAGANRVATEWVVATPPDAAVGPTSAAASADGKVVFTVTPTGAAATPKLVVRRFTDGQRGHDGTVSAPAPLAGQPVVVGGMLLLPLADGFVHRHAAGDGKTRPDTLTPGPKWWTDRRQPEAECFAAAVTEDTFVTSDGGKGLALWKWPAAGNWSDAGAKWDVRERVAAPPLALPAAGGKPARLLVADVAGGVWLYPDRGGSPVRRWIPGRTAGLPAGRPTRHGFSLHTEEGGRQVVAYSVDGKHAVCLDVERDLPLWVTQTEDVPGPLVGVPQPAGNGRWLVTELTGRVALLDGATGKPAATRDVGLPGAVPATAGVAVTPTRALVPLSDGSAAVVELGEEAPAKKE